MLMAMRLAGDRAAEHFIRTLDPTQNNPQAAHKIHAQIVVVSMKHNFVNFLLQDTKFCRIYFVVGTKFSVNQVLITL